MTPHPHGRSVSVFSVGSALKTASCILVLMMLLLIAFATARVGSTRVRGAPTPTRESPDPPQPQHLQVFLALRVLRCSYVRWTRTPGG